MDQEAGEPMSENKKSLAGAGTPNQAGEARATDNDQKYSRSHNSTRQEQEQAGFISKFLLTGAGQGLHLQDLVRLTKRTEREVRQMIQAERLRGIPILSNNQDGYFLPGDEAEKAAFVQSMHHRGDEIHRVAEAVDRAVIGWTD